ncbi:DNRLRE domain-containing protein [Listeria ilorinensis]|uniref:DNRLRE domain-containing protein n=1 Tax=Listeria ilorinensis TaxID=2867439 RepID=UPI001EF747DF|nr:DNRLRE domain-containing protein [Listeria ilorinensis]
MKKLKKGFLTLIVSMLILSLMPAYQSSAEDTQPTRDTIETPQKENQQAPTEITEERQEQEIVYDNHDGTFTKQIFTDPVHMEEDGKWVPIDPTLEENSETDTIHTKQTNMPVDFLCQMENGVYQEITETGKEVRMAFKGAKYGAEEVTASDVAATFDENILTYPEVLSKIDLRQRTFNRSIKEDLVLQEKNSFDTYLFELETKLKVNLEEDGSITLKDSLGEVHYTLPKPMMADSFVDEKSGEAHTSDQIYFELEPLTKTVYQIRLKVDQEWLQADERVYPVSIDPSIRLDDIYNANVNSAQPNNNYIGSKLWDEGQQAYTLKIGKYDASTGNNFAYLKLDTSTLNKATIEKAELKVFNKWHAYTNTSNVMYVDEVKSSWSPWQVTWNKRPSEQNIAQTNVGRGSWATFNVKDTVQAWANGTRQNYGFKLATKAQQDHWKKIIASENNSQIPYLEVTYSYPRPEKPTLKTSSNGEGTGTGNLEFSWKAVPGATSYTLVLANGHYDQEINIGNVTSYSTKGKKLYPTAEQLAQGEFEFREDGKGTDFAIDPRPLYENSHEEGSRFSLKGQTKYIAYIKANYNGGESPRSEQLQAYMPIEKPKAPTAKAYSNLAGKNTGYVHLNWAKSPLADGYKVLVFNGKSYEEFDVGDKTEWSTQGKGIWPTSTEIKEGKYALHHDGTGIELATDPSIVYKNAGTTYQNSKNYWFRIIAYQKAGKHAASGQSEAVKPIIPDPNNEQLGMVDYWTSVPVRGGEVNATNGNFLFYEEDFALEGRGPSMTVKRTFNSLDKTTGLFGKGWTSTLEDRLEEQTNGDILWIEADKKQHRFKKEQDKYVAPPGIYSEITKTADGFLKVEEDKSETRYRADGRLLSEKDTSGKQLSYDYQNNQLTKITDASGRMLAIEYENGRIKKITGPENRTVQYRYDENGHLTESTTPTGKPYRYGYTDDQLTAIYDPKHTEAKPYQTTYSYTDGKLSQIIDPVGKKTKLAYDTDKQQVTLTNERGKNTIYQYSDAGNPSKKIEDAAGLKLTTTYTYQSNNLVKEVTPKGQEETYKYDAEGNIIEATDAYGTENYTYNENNDLTKATDVEGKTTTVAYDGADAVSATLKTEGPLSSVAQYDSYGNVIRGSQELAASENLLQNGGFEDQLTGWKMSQFNSNSKGNISHDATTSTTGALGGKGSIKIEGEALTTGKAYTAAIQDVDVEPETTYTVSAYIKAENVKKADGMFTIRLMQADGKDVTDGTVWKDNRATSQQTNSNWTKRQFTFKTTKQTRKVRLYLDNEQIAGGKGKATLWFDQVQLEKGSRASQFNPVSNSSFEQQDTTTATNWGRTGNSGTADARIVSSNSYDGDSAVFEQRTATHDPNTYFGQNIPLNQKEAQSVTVSAMSKAENVKLYAEEKFSVDYSLWVDINYADGTKEYAQAKFPQGTKDWNRSAVVITPKKPIQMLRVVPMFRNGMTGKVWFDNVRIMEGEVLTKQDYDQGGNYVTARYDEVGRKTSQTFDAYGNVLSETDEKGQTKQMAYNLDNQLTETTMANGTKVSYTYDDNGNATSKNTTADGRTQNNTYQYDVDNKITSFTDALGRTIQYEYDASGNETKVQMPNGRITENTYDSADRVSGVKWNGNDAFKFQYDPNGNQTKVTDLINGHVTDKTYDEADRITKVTDRGGSVSYTYKDKPTKESKGKTDKVGEVIVSHGAHQQTVSYGYNDIDQNTTVKDGDKTAYFQYDEFGNIGLYTAGNKTATGYSYDSTQKVTRISVGNPDGDLILEESYTYDANSNRTGIDNKQQGKTSYEYDNINQLTKETLPNGIIKTYAYDGFGNRTQVKVSGAETKTDTASYNEGNQLVNWNGQAITYDTNGNRTKDGQYTYTWDSADRLTAITKNGDAQPFATYTYDDDNRRLSKTVNGKTTHYHYDGDSIDVLYETDNAGKVMRQYIYADNGARLAMKMNGQTLTYHYNGHGDVIALTNASGDIVAEYQYDAWGNVLKSETKTAEAKSNPYGYAGYMYDAEIQQYYLMARYYVPEQGVFTAYDPDPGDEDDPQTMNGYNYANNNPVMHIDPDGHVIWHYVAAAGVGAAWGAGKYYVSNKMRGKKVTWKGAGKAALKGAGSGLMWTGAGRILGVGSKLRIVKKVYKRRSTKALRYTVKKNFRRAKTNPKKHFKNTPGRRVTNVKKASKKSLKRAIKKNSNAIYRIR